MTAFVAMAMLLVVTALLPAEAASDPAPIDLSRDEAYRRDGVLVNMKTCLALADDRSMQQLLEHPFIKNILKKPAVERAEDLAKIDEDQGLRKDPGYGTLLACAQIVAAWHSRNIYADDDGQISAVPSSARSDDGRTEHGALVIDLSLGQRGEPPESLNNRAYVEPETLARLLTTPGLVPMNIYGGIVFKNAIVNGPLILNNIHLTRPVAFVHVRFAGRSFSRGFFGIEKRATATALAISSMRLEGQIVFAHSEFCGSVDIDQSRFDYSLTFRDVKQFAVGCWGQGKGPSAVKLSIRNSAFERSLTFTRSDFVSTEIEGVTTGSLAADRVGFGSRLAVDDGDFGALAFKCSTLAAETSIHRNQIVRDLIIEGNRLSRRSEKPDKTCNDWWRTREGSSIERIVRLSVEGNRIGGGLFLRRFAGAYCAPLSVGERAALASLAEVDKSEFLKNRCEPPGEEKAVDTASLPNEGGKTAPETTHVLRCPEHVPESGSAAGANVGVCLRSALVLKNNHVGGRSDIVLPGPRKTSQTDTSDLNTKDMWQPWVADVDFLGSTYEGTLSLGLDLLTQTDGVEGTAESEFCTEIDDDFPLQGTAIGLRAARVRTLHWDLPLTCDYRWLGYGLTYDMWLRGDLAHRSLGATADQAPPAVQDHLALKAWRRTLRYYDAPSLDMMSQYLVAKGQYLDSLSILREAKRLNYTPTCKPDGSTPSCAGTIIGAFGTSLADAGRLIGRAWAAEEGDGSSGPPDDARSFPQILWDSLGWLGRLCILVLLWPVGYGAEPYRALLLLVGFFAVCWVIYYLHAQKMRRRLDDAWAVIDPVIAPHLERDSERRSTVTRDPGFAEERAVFNHLLANGQETDWVWPSEEAWRERMTDAERLREIRGPLLTKVKAWGDVTDGENLEKLRRLRSYLEDFGSTDIPGFGRFDINKMPTRFSSGLYSFDTMVPVIDLHAYSNYYPIARWPRMLSVVQHVAGWWWVTVFIASAAIL